jgi:hypothetical protein
LAARENPFVHFLTNRGYELRRDGFFAKPGADISYRTKHDDFNCYIQGMVVSQGAFLQTFMHNLNVAFNDSAWQATFQRYNYAV